MGIPGVLKYLANTAPFAGIVARAPRHANLEQHESVVFLVDGNELLIDTAKRAPASWAALVEALRERIVGLVQRSGAAPSAVEVRIVFSGVLARARLWGHREHSYVDAKRGGAPEFPAWFRAHDVSPGVPAFESAVDALAALDWPFPARVYHPSRPGGSDNKLLRHANRTPSTATLVLVGTSAETLLMAVRLGAANLSRPVIAAMQSSTRHLSFVDAGHLARTLSSVLDDGVHVEDFALDLAALFAIVGGDCALPRSFHLDIYADGIDRALEAYAAMRRADRSLRLHRRDARLRPVPHRPALLALFSELAARTPYRLVPVADRSTDAIADDYARLLEWSLTTAASGTPPSWTWTPAARRRYAPGPAAVRDALARIELEGGDHLRADDEPQHPQEQLAAVLPPALFPEYLEGEWLRAAERAAASTDYPREVQRTVLAYRHSPRSRLDRLGGVGLDDVPLLRLESRARPNWREEIRTRQNWRHGPRA